MAARRGTVGWFFQRTVESIDRRCTMSMRWMTLLPCCVVLVLLTGCRRDIATTTQVRPDGSVERTVTVSGDSSAVLSGSFPVPRDTTWAITQTVGAEKKGERKFTYTARKTFRTVSDLNADFGTIKDNVLQVHIFTTLDKRFRWFNTFYVYHEMYRASNPFRRVPISNYLDAKELELYCQMVDTLKKDTLGLEKKFNDWIERTVLEDFYQVLLHEAETIRDPILTPRMVSLHKDELFRALQNDSIDLGNSEKLLRFLETIFKTKSVRKMSSAVVRFEKEFENKQGFLSQMMDDRYTNQVVMPGTVLDTDAHTVEGSRAVWTFNGRRFLWTDFEMRVESRVVNRWAVYVTAAFLLVVFARIAVLVLKR